MVDRWLEKMEGTLDGAASFLWELFEKDMRMAEAIIERTENAVSALQGRIPSSVRRLFSRSAE